MTAPWNSVLWPQVKSHTLIPYWYLDVSDHATHWKIPDVFDTWLFHRGFFGTKLFLSFLRSKAPVHLNGLESTSMSPLSWGRSAIGNNCQSSNKILCNDRVLWGAESRSDPLCRCLSSDHPAVRGNINWNVWEKRFIYQKKGVMCYAFFNYVHSTVRKPSGSQHLHTSSWALDSMGTCTRELGGLRSLNSYEAKSVVHAKCNCFISLFQQVFGVSQSWKTSSEGLGPRNVIRIANAVPGFKLTNQTLKNFWSM